MPYRRKRTYYVRLRPAGYPHRIGPLSTRTRTKSLAQQMEATVRELAAMGRHDVLDALKAGDFDLPELHAAKVNGRLAALQDGADDPPLLDAVRRFLSSHDDMRYAHAMRRLLDVAPENARVSWLAEPVNLRKLLRHYREKGLSASTERREIPGISVLVREHFGEARRREVFQELTLRRPLRGRDRWLTADEIRTIRDVAGNWWLIIGTTIATGARRGELLALHVRDHRLPDGIDGHPEGQDGARSSRDPSVRRNGRGAQKVGRGGAARARPSRVRRGHEGEAALRLGADPEGGWYRPRAVPRPQAHLRRPLCEVGDADRRAPAAAWPRDDHHDAAVRRVRASRSPASITRRR